MESIPIEIIGNILSCLEGARNLVLASATCKKWLEARKNYISTLKFGCQDEFWRHQKYIEEQDIITRTIFETSGLECLSIARDGDRVDSNSKISIEFVISWIKHVKKTLLELYYSNSITINIFEKFDLPNLKILTLDYKNCTTRDTLPLDLSLLHIACPKIETLTLKNVHVVKPVHLRSISLKDIYIHKIYNNSQPRRYLEVTLELDKIEKLCLNFDFVSCSFKLICKDTLKYLKIEKSLLYDIDIGESLKNLEVLDIHELDDFGKDSTLMWENFKSTISRSQKLRRLRIWKNGIDFYMDMKMIFGGFPLLTHLSLCYLNIDVDHYEHNYDETFDINELLIAAKTHWQAKGSLQSLNMAVLELRWKETTPMFVFWVVMFLESFPNLKKLVIIKDRKEEIEYIKEEIEDMKDNIEKMKNEIMDMEKKIGCMEDDIIEKENKIACMRNGYTGMNDKNIVDMEIVIANMEEDIATMEDDIADLKEDIANMEEEIEESTAIMKERIKSESSITFLMKKYSHVKVKYKKE